MVRQWSQTSMTFLTITERSNAKGVQISTRVNNNLAASPSVATLYTQYNGKHLAYITAYDEHQIQEAVVKAKTQEVQDLFDGLVPTARDWDLAIQTKYASKGTPDYTRILPTGRAPFYSGKKDMRIRAVNQLALKTASISVLAAVHSGADAYYTQINTLVTEQNEAMQILDNKRAALEAARVAACEGMESVLGGLKQLFPNDPKRIDEFFPLDLIRNIPQKVFTGSVAALEINDIVKRKMKLTTMIRLKNTGLVKLEFYFAAIKGGPVPDGTIPVVVEPGYTSTVSASALGADNHPYLMVRNLSEIVEGEYEVTIGS